MEELQSNGKTESSLKESIFGFFGKNEEKNEKVKEKYTKKVELSIDFSPFKEENRVAGSYVWGDTGCGKTFLLDLFFDNLQITEKRRLHYNSFMLQIHQSNFRFSNVVL